jgi:hypothetical protein
VKPGKRLLLAAFLLPTLLLFSPVAEAQYEGYQGGQQQYGARDRTCQELEQQLANDWTRNGDAQSELPRIQEEIRRYNQVYRSTQSEADRTGCYESTFIFGRSLRRTPRCLNLHNKIEDARRHVARLEEQRRYATQGRGSQRRKDELIEALSRYGCGDQYRRASRRRRGIFSWFGGEDFFRPRENLQTSRIVPYATYRTLCVRLCDGYYFPISYSTLPSRFSQDAGRCQSRCAAPAELFVYRNPGEEPEQMVSLEGKAYNELPDAWRYRKEYVKGCSCKTAEFSPNEIKPVDSEAGEAPAAPGATQVAKENEPQAAAPQTTP